MIKYFEGTVFNVGAEALVNTVNCVGVMGSGIALEFMLRFPDMYEDYVEKCRNNFIKPEKIDFYTGNDYTIINFPTKLHFKYPSKLQWIEGGLRDFVNRYRQYKIKSVAFPKLGTNKGGLNWDDVKELMEKYLSKIEIDVYICLDDKPVAEGIEKIMLDGFNSMNIDDLSSYVKLNRNQKEIIEISRPYNRFWKISQTKGLGIRTYSNLFRHFYNCAVGSQVKPIQISIYDIFDL